MQMCPLWEFVSVKKAPKVTLARLPSPSLPTAHFAWGRLEHSPALHFPWGWDCTRGGWESRDADCCGPHQDPPVPSIRL